MSSRNKERNLKSSFTIETGNNDYEFRLKKKRNLWWLLLLLLPLVLLIPLKKDVTVITQTSDGKPVANVEVSMRYTASYLLWDGKFLVDKPYNRSQTTDEEGKTVFKGVGFSVYSFIFKFNRQVVVTVDDDRFEEPVAKRRFHTTRKVVFEMEPRYSLTFQTMLEVEGEIVDVLPDCDLVVTVDGEQVEPDNSGSGTFTVEDLLLSSSISIVASKEFYGSNSTKVNNRSVYELYKAPQSERDIPLEKMPEPTPPSANCGVHFSGGILSDDPSHFVAIFSDDPIGEYVGSGYYPYNKTAFPNSVKYTFDGIAVDCGTHLIIYSEPNFEGEVLLDVVGPMLINNVLFNKDKYCKEIMTKTFVPDLEAIFPPSRRQWSSEDMRSWSNGSCKIICDE